jgi:hypothetical protein
MCPLVHSMGTKSSWTPNGIVELVRAGATMGE